MSISIFVGSELYTPLQAEKTVMQMRTEHCTRTGSEEQRASRSVYRGADAWFRALRQKKYRPRDTGSGNLLILQSELLFQGIL